MVDLLVQLREASFKEGAASRDAEVATLKADLAYERGHLAQLKLAHRDVVRELKGAKTWNQKYSKAMRRRKHGAQVTSGHRRAAAIAIDDAIRFLEGGGPDLALEVLRAGRARAYTPQESKRFAALEELFAACNRASYAEYGEPEPDVICALRRTADAVRAHSGFDPGRVYDETAAAVKAALHAVVGGPTS